MVRACATPSRNCSPPAGCYRSRSMRNPPDPALVKLALDELRSGSSPADVAVAAGVSEACIKQWRRKYGGNDPALSPRTSMPAALEARAAARAEEPTTPTAESVFASLPPDASSLERNVALQKVQFKIADEAFAIGNYSAAQKSMRDATQTALAIARIEKELRSDGDQLHISKAEIDAAKKSYRERVRTLLDRPLLCAHCSRELSIAWTDAPPADQT